MQEDDPFVTVTVTTDIAAPPETVWQILTEFSLYSAWHPVMSLDGAAPELAPGARLAFRLSGGAAGDQAFTAELTQVGPPHMLAWQGGIPGVFGLHTFELRAIAGDGTRFTDTERWSGSMAASAIADHHAVLEKEYARSAGALKEEAERGGQVT
jgi:uncharacterized protein YndB with AHSA1/START domain